MAEGPPAPVRGVRRTREKLRELDSQPGSVKVARVIRSLLPGEEPEDELSRRLSALTAERPSAMREVGLSALQVWQALSEAQGRGRGQRELSILFTDLVGFSEWALEAGDTMAIDLLREVTHVVEPPVLGHGGTVVKRLGDGLMAVFSDPAAAVSAALEAVAALNEVEVGGHRPVLRAGVHLGKPRKVGRDYLGVDVNVAARVAEAAGAGEVLASGAVAERLDGERLELKRKRRFKAKGAPDDLQVFAVARTP